VLKLASDTWERLKPDGRPTTFWLAARTVKLGCDSLTCALNKITEALGRAGKIPASIRQQEAVVRSALCPDHSSALLLKRHTAWCRRMDRTCPHLLEEGDDWVSCDALGVAPHDHETQAGLFDVSRAAPQQKSFLSSLLKILGPAALTGLVVWKAKEKEIATSRQKPVSATGKQYNIVNSLLKSQGLTYSYDTSTRTFGLEKGYIKLTSDGGAILFDKPKGRKLVATPDDLLSKLFQFLPRVR
jgi:hypothetical protein